METHYQLQVFSNGPCLASPFLPLLNRIIKIISKPKPLQGHLLQQVQSKRYTPLLGPGTLNWKYPLVTILLDQLPQVWGGPLSFYILSNVQSRIHSLSTNHSNFTVSPISSDISFDRSVLRLAISELQFRNTLLQSPYHIVARLPVFIISNHVFPLPSPWNSMLSRPLQARILAFLPVASAGNQS